MEQFQEQLLRWVTDYGYGGLFGLLMLGIIGIPFPDELLMTFAGFLVSKGTLRLGPTLLATLAGSCCGITTSYVLGRTLGLRVIHKYGRFAHITPARLDKAHAWFARLGKWSLVVGYFIPGFRHVNAILAGTTALAYPQFALFAYGGAALWCTTFVLLGYFVGEEWRRVGELSETLGIVLAAALAVAAGIYLAVRRIRRTKEL